MSASDKTEAPTPKRKKEARRKGQVAKSTEVVTWSAMLFGSFVLPVTLRSADDKLRNLFAQMAEVIAEPSTTAARKLLGAGASTTLSAVLPLAAAMAAFAIVANLSQTGLIVSPKKLKPSFASLNPLKGFKRLFSVESGWNTVKILLRTAILALAAWAPLRAVIAELAGADRVPLLVMLGGVARRGLTMVRIVCAAGLLLGIADLVVVVRRNRTKMKMTKQEVRDESKSAEGDQHVKGQIRARQREMSRNRMLAGVADASVVIVNPVHVAVALKYEAGGGAPRLIAKGKGEVAKRIRESAEEHRVPMVRDIPLAWALHDTVKLDHPVPAELYGAVAKVLAFVMTVGKRAAALGGAVTVPAH